jgi:chaperonin GroES
VLISASPPRSERGRGASHKATFIEEGGIIIPDTAKEKPMEAEVVAVGKGKVNEEGKQFPLDVKKGDKILIGKYAGTEIKIDDVEHLILREDEVLAVVEK